MGGCKEGVFIPPVPKEQMSIYIRTDDVEFLRKMGPIFRKMSTNELVMEIVHKHVQLLKKKYKNKDDFLDNYGVNKYE